MENLLPVARHRFTELNQLALSVRLGGYACECLSWGFFEPRWWRNYLHIHSHFEICYAYQGRGLFHIANTDYTVQQGDVFIAKPGDVHEIISAEDDPLGIYFWSYTLVPMGERQRETSVHQIDALLDAFCASTSAAIGSRGVGMLRTLELLTEEVTRKEPGYVQVIEGLVSKLVLDTARAVVDSSGLVEHVEGPSQGPEEMTVRTMVRYLRDNYNRPITVRDVAAQVHLSERHTSRLFHKVMGTSILEYLTALRLEIAAQLLLDRQTSIKEVAHECGYPDVRYFITLFRQTTGQTPGTYRRQGGTRFLR